MFFIFAGLCLIYSGMQAMENMPLDMLRLIVTYVTDDSYVVDLQALTKSDSFKYIQGKEEYLCNNPYEFKDDNEQKEIFDYRDRCFEMLYTMPYNFKNKLYVFPTLGSLNKRFFIMLKKIYKDIKCKDARGEYTKEMNTLIRNIFTMGIPGMWNNCRSGIARLSSVLSGFKQYKESIFTVSALCPLVLGKIDYVEQKEAENKFNSGIFSCHAYFPYNYTNPSCVVVLKFHDAFCRKSFSTASLDQNDFTLPENEQFLFNFDTLSHALEKISNLNSFSSKNANMQKMILMLLAAYFKSKYQSSLPCKHINSFVEMHSLYMSREIQQGNSGAFITKDCSPYRHSIIIALVWSDIRKNLSALRILRLIYRNELYKTQAADEDDINSLKQELERENIRNGVL